MRGSSGQVPRQRRALATSLSAEAVARLSDLRHLSRGLLAPLAGASPLIRETEAVVGAVLGTLIGSAVSVPRPWAALATLRREQLDLEAGVMTWYRPGPVPEQGVWQRLPLDPSSRLLWGRLLLRSEPADGKNPERATVLPAGWQDPTRLRRAVRQALRHAGFNSWPGFVATVRLSHLLGGLPPIIVARRAGRVATAVGLGRNWAALGWRVRDPQALLADATVRRFPVVGRVRRAPPVPWRLPVRVILRNLDATTHAAARRRIATALERHLVERPPGAPLPGIGRAYVHWAIALLRAPRRLRPRSVRAMLSRVGRLLDQDALMGALAQAPTTGEATGAVLTLVAATYPAVESRRAGLRALRAFLDFARAEHGRDIPVVRWRLAARVIGQSPVIVALLSPPAVRLVATELRRTGPEGLALAAAVVLAAFGGLRRSEVCQLTVDDVRQRGWLVQIRRTKTSAGRRVVPLGLLLPPWARDVIEAAAAARTERPAHASTWLLTAAGRPWDPDALGARVAAALRRTTGQRVSVHAFRRAAATWWLLQWARGEPGIVLPDLGPDAPPVEGVRRVLGDDPATALFALARLLGHAWPTVTLSRYVAAIDRLEAEVMQPGAGARLPLALAADLLGVTPRWARERLTVAAGEVRIDTVLMAQKQRLACREARWIVAVTPRGGLNNRPRERRAVVARNGESPPEGARGQ
jgi:integrase